MFGGLTEMKIRIIVAVGRVILVLLLLAIPVSSWADDGPDCSILTGFTKARPDPDGPPTPIRIAIRLIGYPIGKESK